MAGPRLVRRTRASRVDPGRKSNRCHPEGAAAESRVRTEAWRRLKDLYSDSAPNPRVRHGGRPQILRERPGDGAAGGCAATLPQDDSGRGWSSYSTNRCHPEGAAAESRVRTEAWRRLKDLYSASAPNPRVRHGGRPQILRERPGHGAVGRYAATLPQDDSGRGWSYSTNRCHPEGAAAESRV